MAALEAFTAFCTYGLLTSTLFTFRNYTCDNDILRLRCPHTSTIRVIRAQYGRLLPGHIICPSIVGHHEHLSCLAPLSLDVVKRRCDGQERCQLLAAWSMFGDEDPCPGTHKYLQVAFHCQPKSYENVVACEGDSLQLRCDRSFHLAIHGALFGRTPGGANSCQTGPTYDVECQSPCAVRHVMEQCYGKRHCHLQATESHFGQPCAVGTPKYLSVSYSCVSKNTIRSLSHEDDLHAALHLPRCDIRRPDDVTPIYLTPSRSTPGPGANGTDCVLVPRPTTVTGLVSDWSHTWLFLRENTEKFVLYGGVSVTLGLIVILLAVIVHCTLANRRKRRLREEELAFGSAQPSPPGIGSPTHAWPSPWDNGNGDRSLQRRQQRGGASSGPLDQSQPRVGLIDVDVTLERPRPNPIGGEGSGLSSSSRPRLRDPPMGASGSRPRYIVDESDIVVHVQAIASPPISGGGGTLTPSSSLKFSRSPKSSPRRITTPLRQRQPTPPPPLLYQPTPFESHIAGSATGSLQRRDHQLRSAFDNVFR